MDEIYKALFSPLWWFTAMVAGVVASLAASYLKAPVDNLLSGVSVRWKRRSIRKRKEFDNFIETLRSDNTAKIFANLDLLGQKINFVQCLVIAVFFNTLGIYWYMAHKFNPEHPIFGGHSYLYLLFFGLGITFLYAGILSLLQSMKISAAMEEALKPLTSDKEQAETKSLPAGD